MAKLRPAVTRPQKGRAAVEAIVTGVALIAALVLVNVISSRSHARLDLTSTQLFTLSDESKDIVRALSEKVIIKGYYGNIPAEIADQQNFVDALLAEYADASNGKVEYERIDVTGKPDLQAQLKKEGITSFPVNIKRDDMHQQMPIYFHVVMSHLDQRELWMPDHNFTLEGMEYELTTRIKRLGSGKKRVGITTGFGEGQAQALGSPGVNVLGARVGLGDLYDVQPVNWQKEPQAIDSLDILVVNGPTAKVSEAAKYHLDQFIMRGKPVLFLTSGMRWQAGGNQQMQQAGADMSEQPYIGLPLDNGLDDLLAGYGIQVGKDVIFDDEHFARGWLPPGAQGGYQKDGLSPFAEALPRGPKQVLAGLQLVAVPFASTLTLTGDLASPPAEDEVIPLLRTAPSSYVHKDMIALMKEQKGPVQQAGQGPFLVGVAVSGTWKSAFAGKAAPPDPPPAAPQGMPPGMPPGMRIPGGEADGADQPAPAPVQLEKSAGHTRIAVIGSSAIGADTTLLDINLHHDPMVVTGFVALHDVVDWLGEETALVALRSKKVERPVKHTDPGTRAFLKYGNVVGAPLLLCLFGVAYWWMRERRRRNVEI